MNKQNHSFCNICLTEHSVEVCECQSMWTGLESKLKDSVCLMGIENGIYMYISEVLSSLNCW